jgi:alpha-2-macroglobulin
MKHFTLRVAWLVVLVVLGVPASSGAQNPPPAGTLAVVSAGPDGEVAELANANEVRVVFSEPMVELGRIPSPVTAPFFKMTPAVPGTFRWSGTTILVFTPEPKRGLRYATRYEVTIAASAQAQSGRRLARPYTFSFTTPTARLVEPRWYRKGGTFTEPVLVVLRFNQPVRPDDVLAHAKANFQKHKWDIPAIPPEDQARLKMADPQALDRFNAKVAATDTIASTESPVALKTATDWDKKKYPPSPRLVVLETTTPVPPGSWMRLVLDEKLPSPAGPATPGKIQEYTVQAEEAFFATSFDCRRECDPERSNPLNLTRPVKAAEFASAVKVIDITTPGREVPVAQAKAPKSREGDERDVVRHATLEDAGFEAQPPAKTFAVLVDGNLRSIDGQTLGYTWVGTIENWHRTAFTSFGDGHGVWESSGGAVLPFYARNFGDVKQWAQRIEPGQLMPTVQALEDKHFTEAPAGPGHTRQLPLTVDKIQSHGLDMRGVLDRAGNGLVWAAVEEGKEVPRAHREYKNPADKTPIRRATLVQVTNLGIAVKDSPENTLVFVTRLDNGAPVAGARVSIIRPDNSTFWSGTTASDGVIIAPQTTLRKQHDFWEQKLEFIVTAEKDGDVAYVGSDWNEGLAPWEFGLRFDLGEADALLRGTVFTDRGVYRLGEEVHLKAILRQNTPSGIRPLPAGAEVSTAIYDSMRKIVDQRKVTVGRWSSAEWTFKLPDDGNLGDYSLVAFLEQDRVKPAGKPEPDQEPSAERGVPYDKIVSADFLVAAYRRPDFRVDVNLSPADAAAPPIAGAPLKGVVTARYLFGAPMGGRPVTWTFSKTPVWSAPDAVYEKFSEDRWAFVGAPEDERLAPRELQHKEAALANTGDLPLELKTTPEGGIPWRYVLEGDVEDVSRQHIANRAQAVVHPAAWYVGLRRPSYFVQQKDGVKTEIVAVTPAGTAAGGVSVEVTLTQIQWKSVRRAEGEGFYTWETQKSEVPAGKWTVTTTEPPVPLEIPVPNGGYFVLRARATDTEGRSAVTTTSFYALGEGYTAWARYDHSRIDLVPERKTYRPGDTARIMIQSPWEKATALVTTEREGIRSHRQFALTSTQQAIEVPVTGQDIPNLYVSVLLVKGRTQQPGDPLKPNTDVSDPGKPAFRLGYAELKVENKTKRLSVAVRADKEEYRPANTATVTVDVRDSRGAGAASEVTLWAVDYGVLSLTGYKTPDVLDSVYVQKALQVINSDNRQRIVSRRVLTPKGATEGGGGGADAGAGTLRKDFRVLAFWLGSVVTDANGHARVEVKLPESLTTYRVMAVAGDLQSRFGSADSEVRINKPVTLKAAFPRFLAVGDKASFGAVVTSQLKTAANATVTIKSLDPNVLGVTGAAQQAVALAAGGASEVRFDFVAKAIGRARLQIAVRAGSEGDAFEDVLPIEVLASPETVAAYGEAGDGKPTATETLTIPAGVVPGFGGLHVDVASTAMVGLNEGASYLVEYPYGCAEQRASRALALLLAADLGDAFRLPGIEPAQLRSTVQAALKELEKFQCSSGGFAYWAGDCTTGSAYLTAYLLHVFKVASDLKYAVDADRQKRAYDYLQKELSQPPPVNEGWWPSYTAWQAFAAKVLAEGGRNQDSNLTRLYGYRDRMPVFALAYLRDGMAAAGESSGPRAEDLGRRLANAILVEGGSAHVEEVSDPYLLWYWSSHTRSTAIALNTLVRTGGGDAAIRGLVHWLMTVRKNGRWGNTQENAMAMEALVAYYRKYESVVPDFRATVKLGSAEVARKEFKGRSTAAATTDLSMAQVLAQGAAGTSRPLTFTRDGTGTLFYTARLRYAADQLFQQGLDSGMAIERSYAPYVESGERPPATTSFKAGDLVRVTLTLQLTKERRFVAVTDPLAAGFEPVESWFKTTAAALAEQQDEQPEATRGWFSWWQRGGFDHVERRDDSVVLFATRLSEGRHTFSYIVRATTAGTFRTAPAHAEEMYEPEVFGRTATAVVDIRK